MRLNNDKDETPTSSVSSDLVERCKRGDQHAWTKLVEATHRDVYTLCLRILRDPDDAAEATQDAFVKVWRNLHTFRGDALFTTWLYRIAANTAISRQRSRKRRWAREHSVEDDVLSDIPSPTSLEETASDRMDIGALENALAALPHAYRAAVVLRDIYGLTTQELARELKISETAAKVRVHRGRKRLKEMLADTRGPRSEEGT